MPRFAMTIEVAFRLECAHTVVAKTSNVTLSLEIFTLMIAPARVTTLVPGRGKARETRNVTLDLPYTFRYTPYLLRYLVLRSRGPRRP
jgi:hypothetical protein